MNYLDELKREFSKAAGESADRRRARLLDLARSFAAEKKEELCRMHFEGASGAAVVAAYTALADSLVESIYSAAVQDGSARSPHALVALGGYGRKELCFCSDLDIMLLHGQPLDKGIEALNDYLLYFLWDLGFEVGHSIRSTADAMEIAGSDDTALTSMLESRLLAGDESMFEGFIERLSGQLKSSGVKRFIRKKQRERGRSYRKAGGDIYHIEPNVKQTAGGLRDYHAGVWIALARFGLKSPRQLFGAGLLTEEQFLKLERALDFLWRVRNQMHLENGSPQDVLTLRLQERIAHAFGYRASRGALEVELFMQDYYIHASELHGFYKEMLRLGGLSQAHRGRDSVARGGKVERGLRIARRQVYLPAKDANWFRENPARLLEVIWYSQKEGFTLSASAMRRIKADLNLIDEQFRASPVARDYFMAILSDPLRVGSSVRLMNDVGILDRYLPEFSAIRDLVRYRPFHQHPVNEHTLRALESLAAIPHLREPGANVLKKILFEISAPETLSLAILLHDAGKVEDGPHAEAGTHIAEKAGKRLCLEDSQMQTLRFLVRNHTKMTRLSRYRDLDDPKIIRSFASDVGSEENLNMLYLLTFADLNAVRQGAWSDWISALLYHLYSHTRDALAQPTAPSEERAEYWETPKARAICEYHGKGDFSFVKEHLMRMSSRYLDCFSPNEIAEHMRMASSLHRQNSALKCVPVPGYSLSKVTVCTKDRPGLFAEIAGTFASQRVSVLSAAIFTRSDGVAIDSFHVVDANSDGPLASTKWAVVKENLRKVLRGERRVAELIRRAERSPLATRRAMLSLRRSVSFDNSVSATHTIIDIQAPDRVGLLYDIASMLFGLGLNLSLARVATDARQARDAFYVTDSAGAKITGPLRIEEIRRKIEGVLEAGSKSNTLPKDAPSKTRRNKETNEQKRRVKG